MILLIPIYSNEILVIWIVFFFQAEKIIISKVCELITTQQKTLSIPVLLAWVPHAPFQQSAPPEAEHAGTKALVDEVFHKQKYGNIGDTTKKMTGNQQKYKQKESNGNMGIWPIKIWGYITNKSGDIFKYWRYDWYNQQ